LQGKSDPGARHSNHYLPVVKVGCLAGLRIIIGFVKPLDFAAVKALVPDLKRCAKGFGCA
jgi:hypothetical protein